MPYNIDSASDNCYFGTTVLINKLNLTDEAILNEAETLMVLVKSAEIEQSPPNGDVCFDYYKQLHKALFEDLYAWAGTVRSIKLSKKGTNFYPPEEIERCGVLIFERARELSVQTSLSKKEFADKIADLYSDLNLLHPFREGNGRAQRLFTTILVRKAGHDIDFASCDTDELMTATIYSAQGVMDYLRNFFEENLI